MDKELAKTLTTALVQFIDKERPEGTMDCSSGECVSLEKAFTEENFDSVETLINKKLSRLTEFEQALSNYLKNDFEYFHTKKWDEQKWNDVIRTQSKELLDLAKKELARQDEVITLDKLPPYDKGFQDGKAEALKDLPRWRRWENGACGNSDNIPIAIVKRGYNYELVSTLGIQGEHYIMLSDLEKLPGFDNN